MKLYKMGLKYETIILTKNNRDVYFLASPLDSLRNFCLRLGSTKLVGLQLRLGRPLELKQELDISI